MKEFLEIDELPELISELRKNILCGDAGEGLDAVAEQNFLLGLSALEQAQRFFMLALIDVRRARVAQGY